MTSLFAFPRCCKFTRRFRDVSGLGLRDEALGLWVWGVGTWDSRIGLIRFGAFRAARF